MQVILWWVVVMTVFIFAFILFKLCDSVYYLEMEVKRLKYIIERK